MAYKYCEYCRKNCDSKYTECPSCAAPLENKVHSEDGNLKESFTHTLDKAVNSFSDALFKSKETPPPEAAQSGAQSANSPSGSDTQRYANKWIALLLLLIGGALGAHKLYEGKLGMAVLYFFTGGLFFVGCVVDFVKILCKPEKYPAKKNFLIDPP